jgi:hypothetical protein
MEEMHQDQSAFTNREEPSRKKSRSTQKRFEQEVEDLGTLGGTISDYSISTKNALSINMKNSLYRKASKETT